MNTVIRTNMLSLNAHRNLGAVSTQQVTASQRLSSGYRINTAADDAAGLSISGKMRAQIRGLDQAARNAQDAISLIQTAEGAMSTVGELLVRVRELVVQAANDTYLHDVGNLSQSDRRKIQLEINQIMDEINSISRRTEFNTMRLLQGYDILALANLVVLPPGTHTFVEFLGFRQDLLYNHPIYGVLREDVLVYNISSFDGSGFLYFYVNMEVGDHFIILGNNIPQVSTTRIRAIDTDGNIIESHYRLDFENVPSATRWRVEVEFEGDPPPEGTTRTISAGIFRFTNLQNHKSKNSFWFQLGANSSQGMNLNIPAMDTNTLGGIYGDLSTLINVENPSGSAIAQQLRYIDHALAFVNRESAALGASINRLEFTINNLNLASENLSATESRIKDADMALEKMRFTRANILQQAAIAMLAQANQSHEAVLQVI